MICQIKGTSATPKQKFLAPPLLGLNTTAQDNKVNDTCMYEDLDNDDHGDGPEPLPLPLLGSNTTVYYTWQQGIDDDHECGYD